MSWTEHELLVDLANYLDYLHWNSSNLEAMNRVVAPIACRTDFGTLVILAK